MAKYKVKNTTILHDGVSRGEAISKEYVILHYSEIEITKCGLFKR